MAEDNLPKISVIVPIYGSFDPRRAILSLESVLNQNGVDLEVIVSEQGEESVMRDLLPAPAIHIFTYHKPSPELSDFNPGRIRNIAAKRATGDFMYTNDADIIFLNEYFLRDAIKLINLHPPTTFKRPPLRRLPADNFDAFWKQAHSISIGAATRNLDLHQEYLATVDGVARNLKVVQKKTPEYTKTFTTGMDNFMRYTSDKTLKGKEPMIWTENVHCGGNLIPKFLFFEIGGYCEQFINWGCEDSDLQWKVGAMSKMDFFPKEDRFTVIHLDHPKNYFSGDMWARNERICSMRKERGIHSAIEDDCLTLGTEHE
jgi:glycosyltransferase involved in cell wall biosynthesis